MVYAEEALTSDFVVSTLGMSFFEPTITEFREVLLDQII